MKGNGNIPNGAQNMKPARPTIGRPSRIISPGKPQNWHFDLSSQLGFVTRLKNMFSRG
jgi:hypothetical protein